MGDLDVVSDAYFHTDNAAYGIVCDEFRLGGDTANLCTTKADFAAFDNAGCIGKLDVERVVITESSSFDL